MSKDYFNIDLADRVADRITRPYDAFKSYMETYKAAISSISYNDTLSESVNSLVRSVQDLYKVYDISNNSVLANMQSLVHSVSEAVSATSALHLQSVLDVFRDIDYSGLASIEAATHIIETIPDDITVDTVSELVENGKITDEDLQAELKSTITGIENESAKSKPRLIQKALKFVAIQLILFLIAAVFSPVTDKVKEELVETFRMDEFWQSTGIIDWIDSWSNDNHTATEDEAKATVDESKTGNISKQKREDLLSKVKEIRNFISNAPQDENTGNLLSYLSEIEKDINGKKYGLVFEEHREDIDEVLETHTSVLTEEPDLFIDKGGQMNFLIEGDNLASLKLLEKTHKGKIDLIYIDPPYNRGGNDFRYDDNYIEKQDSFRHSKWLSFIKPRLDCANKLLKNDGVIFISIDDFEIGALRLLCDDVFGESSFVCNIVWQKRYSRENREAIGDAHEYILVYAKDKLSFKKKRHLVPMSEEQAKVYKNPNNDPKGRWRAVPMTAQGYRPNQMYPIVDPNGGIHYPPEGRCWSTLESEYKKLLSEGRIYFGKSNNSQPNTIRYLSEVSGVVPWTWWNNEDVGHTDEAKKELYSILGKTNSFETPKPVRLIMRILEIASEKDSVILDFFAGSGTTGQAVMKLNAVDKGNRRFILCTNNENNICRNVTYERISRVIDKEKYAASLKYYKVDYLPISERLYYEYADELLKHIRELVELENGINFIGNAEIAIVLTDEELDDFTQNIKQYSACRKLYLGHDLLPDEDQERIIEENNIEINIIPDYYYRDLQEA